MDKIIYIDLSSEIIKEEEFDIKNVMEYGRGLASYLITKHVPCSVDRFDDENVIALVPGLCSGTLIPSTGRITVACKKSKGEGIQFANLAGPFPQKLASMNITAVVIKGKSSYSNPVSIVLTEAGVHIEKDMKLKDAVVTKTIHTIREKYGNEAAIIGIGPSGEHLLPLASMFTTYPEERYPEYHCTRGGMGDVFGSKGIKAIVVKNKHHFKASVEDSEHISKCAKKLGKIIVSHPICGGALPGYGSIALMKMLKQGKNIPIPEAVKNTEHKGKANSETNKINRACSPICVIGCLNRHAKDGDSVYSSPAESEVCSALKEAFSIDDKAFAGVLNKEAFELGLDSVELVFSCAMYFKAINKNADKEDIMNILEEIKNLTVVGRLIGSRTKGIFELYKDRNELKPMVTKPSVSEESKFNILIKSKPESLKDISDLDYLYAMMSTLGNFGICLFSAFALIECEDILPILSETFYYKTGLKIEPSEIVKYSLNCMEREIKYEESSKLNSAAKTIPEFVKVLYRYFDKNIR